jgi:hypothetical protein
MLTIEGVGRLQHKSFVADSDFLTLLNPATTPVRIKRQNKGAISAALIASFIGVGIIFGAAAWFFFNDEQKVYPEINEQQNTPTPDIAEVENIIIEEQVEEVIPEEPVEVVEPEIIEVADDWTQESDVRHWVVAGSYSTEQNANIAKDALVAEHSDLTCNIISLGKMYAVAVYGSVERDDCVEFMREHGREIENMWIFTPKKYL